jgi:hypothetical protein
MINIERFLKGYRQVFGRSGIRDTCYSRQLCVLVFGTAAQLARLYAKKSQAKLTQIILDVGYGPTC